MGGPWKCRGTVEPRGLPNLLHTPHLEVLLVLLTVQCGTGWKERLPWLSDGKNGAGRVTFAPVAIWSVLFSHSPALCGVHV